MDGKYMGADAANSLSGTKRSLSLAGGRGHSLAAMVLLGLLFVSGCASFHGDKARPEKSVRQESKGSGSGWWYARFVIDWPEDAEPLWYTDVLLARELVAPALRLYRNDVILWRFHRRAGRDQTGHQFSFIFYSPPRAAKEIYRFLESRRLLKDLKTEGVILKIGFDDTSRIARPNIEDTSDRHWSLPVQRSWPYYIMGVSEMWLDLVEQIAERTPGGRSASSVQEIQAFYRRVNDQIEETWQQEGRHALLHHLNALFGYEPLIVYEKRFMNF